MSGTQKTRPRHRTVPILTAGLCAVVTWSLFYPAIMSPDSLDLYGQALANRYSDLHPPLLAFVLHGVMRINGSIGALVLLQAIAVCLGVWFLSGRVLKHTGVMGGARPWLSLAVLLVLVSPFSPLPFLMVTFWTDSWLAIFLLWFAGLADWEYERADGSLRGLGWIPTVLLPVLAASMLAVRHNAIVLAPALCFVLWLIGRRRFGRVAALAPPALALGLYFALQTATYSAFQVYRSHAENQVMALDLVGLITKWPAVAAELPYTASQLRPGYAERYRVGDVSPLYYQKPPIVSAGYTRFALNPELHAEYTRAVVAHPLLVAILKAEAWWKLLSPYSTRHWVFGRIVDNRFGLSQTHTLQRAREIVISLEEGIFSLRPIAWLAGSHLIWLLTNILWIVCLTARHATRPAPARLFWVSLLLIPFTYYLSFALAAPSREFRYMYPSTLLIQIPTLAAMASWLWQRSRSGGTRELLLSRDEFPPARPPHSSSNNPQGEIGDQVGQDDAHLQRHHPRIAKGIKPLH